MAEAVKKETWLDPWLSPKEDWEYITIPKENVLGQPHPNMSNNNHTFLAGETYLVPATVAGDIKARLQRHAKACIRVLQPGRDMATVRLIPSGSVQPD